MCKKYILAFTVFLYCLEVLQANAEVIYGCTRRASKGRTQTYIAPFKNGAPYCNNKNHLGPFAIVDPSQIASAGEQGPAGKDGVSGANVTGILHSCHLEGGSSMYESSSENYQRVGHCVLDGTSFTFRNVFGDASSFIPLVDQTIRSVNDDKAFTLYHVPAGTYTLKCDIQYPRSIRSPFEFLQTSVSVTTQDSGIVNVGTIDLCDADNDGVTISGGDCDDTNFNISPNYPFETCDGKDNNCNGQIDEGNVCGM